MIGIELTELIWEVIVAVSALAGYLVGKRKSKNSN